MSHEFAMVTPHGEQIRLVIDQQAQCPPPGADAVQMPPTPEQVRATEAVFSHDSKESDQVLGLLGLWTSALVLHDVAVETFDPPAEEMEDAAGDGAGDDEDDHPHLPGS